MPRKVQAPTVYDHIDFPDYQYREFPLMMYHPAGKMTGRGPNSQIESMTVNNEQERDRLLADGWHDHPSKALEAAAAAPAPSVADPALAAALDQARTLLLANGIDPDTGKPVAKPMQMAPAKKLTLAELGNNTGAAKAN